MNETPEEHQIHALQTWWQRYGALLITLGVLGAGGFVGWDQWQSFEQRKILAASDIYQRILQNEAEAQEAEIEPEEEEIAEDEEEIAEDEEYAEDEEFAEDEEYAEDEEFAEDEEYAEDEESAEDREGAAAAAGEQTEGDDEVDPAESEDLESEDVETAEERAEIARQKRAQAVEDIQLLREQYPDTSYAHYATLLLVRYEVEAGRLTKAEELLEWIRVYGEDDELIALATLRLARVLHALGKGERAITMLRNEPSRSFTPMFRETIGDIFWDYGRGSQALQEYRLAERLYRDSIRNVPPSLTMKIQELEGLVDRR